MTTTPFTTGTSVSTPDQSFVTASRPLAASAERSVAANTGRKAAVPQPEQEPYHALLRNLPWPGDGMTRRLKMVALTSCYSGEGVSTVAIHTAIAAAQSGNYKVLLADANLYDPTLHDAFGVPQQPGLCEQVLGQQGEDLQFHRTQLDNLWLLPAGQGNPATVYDTFSSRSQWLGSLRETFDLVLFDMPAATEGASATHVLPAFDGVVLVVEDERVRWQVAQRTTRALRRAGANLVGAAFNKRHQHIPDWLYRRL